MDSAGSEDSIVAVDLNTGARSEFSTNSGGANPFDSPRSIGFDRANGRLLVGDYTADAIIAVDPETGERVYLSK